MSSFKRATKQQSKLRMALAGPSGAGKTYTSLTLATALADGQPIALIDTERGSASKYADLFTFDVLELEPPYHPDRYIAAMQDAAAAGYAVLVIDSLSHAWNGAGGLLEIVEGIAKRTKGGNTYAAWADATPIQNRLVNAITGAPLHVIVTMRSKQEYVQDKDERGKTTIRKVGMAPIQRDQIEYEFDVAADMDQDNTLVVSKTRCSALNGAVIPKPGKPLADILAAWLGNGAEPQQPAETAQPEPEQPTDELDALDNQALAARIGVVGNAYRDTLSRICGPKPAKGYTERHAAMWRAWLLKRNREEQALAANGHSSLEALPVGSEMRP